MGQKRSDAVTTPTTPQHVNERTVSEAGREEWDVRGGGGAVRTGTAINTLTHLTLALKDKLGNSVQELAATKHERKCTLSLAGLSQLCTPLT